MQIRYGDHDPARHKGGFITDALETFVPAHLLHNQLKTAEWEKCVPGPFSLPPAFAFFLLPLAMRGVVSFVLLRGLVRCSAHLCLAFFPHSGASTKRMQSSVGQRTSCPCIASTCNMRANGSATVPQFSPVFWPNTSAAVSVMPSTTRAVPSLKRKSTHFIYSRCCVCARIADHVFSAAFFLHKFRASILLGVNREWLTITLVESTERLVAFTWDEVSYRHKQRQRDETGTWE